MEVCESKQTSAEVKLKQALLETLKEPCHAICCLFKNLERFLRQLNSKNNGAVLLVKTVSRPLKCFLSSDVTDGEEGHELKLEKVGSPFSGFNILCLQKSPKKF